MAKELKPLWTVVHMKVDLNMANRKAKAHGSIQMENHTPDNGLWA